VKDDYTFDFLELGEPRAERELERAMVSRIEGFLRVMGGLFAFVGRQYRLEVDGREYSVDLLLFHRRLRCLVAVELKVGEFEPDHQASAQGVEGSTPLARADRQPAGGSRVRTVQARWGPRNVQKRGCVEVHFTCVGRWVDIHGGAAVDFVFPTGAQRSGGIWLRLGQCLIPAQISPCGLRP